MNTLLLTTFFPNSVQPTRTVFVKNLANELRKRCGLTVVAPVPYAPPLPGGKWSRYREIPAEEDLDGFHLFHPRYAVIPGQERLTGFFYYRSLYGFIKKMHGAVGFSLIHAHCAYPDGYGAFLIARRLKLPIIVTAHGSDINRYAAREDIRPLVKKSLSGSARVIAVSNALKEKIVSLGVDPKKVEVIPCAAADAERFAPRDKVACREAVGADKEGKVIVFVGDLVQVKGISFLLRAVDALREKIPGLSLYIVGDGALRETLMAEAEALGLSSVVRFKGAVPHAEVPEWIGCADVLCLPSMSEGMPNVVIEALSSGVPVVASMVGGIPDVVKDGVNGFLVPPAECDALARALERALAARWDIKSVTVGTEGFRWASLAERNISAYRDVLEG